MRLYCVYNMRNKLYSGFDNIEDSKSVIIKYFMIYCINFRLYKNRSHSVTKSTIRFFFFSLSNDLYIFHRSEVITIFGLGYIMKR